MLASNYVLQFLLCFILVHFIECDEVGLEELHIKGMA